MSIELVRNLVMHDRRNAECTTASLSAILHEAPEKLTIDALYQNTYSLREMAFLTVYELLNQENEVGVKVLMMKDNNRPSLFFTDVARRLRHGKKEGIFIGGYMLTKDDNGRRHLVAITSFHESKIPKVTVCNTNPKGRDNSIIKREPISWLDRNIYPNDGIYRDRAVALIGVRLDMQNEQVVTGLNDYLTRLSEMRTAMLKRKS